MKNDAEVRILMRERRKGRTQAVAAARAGMSERTARKYEQTGTLPSALKHLHHQRGLMPPGRWSKWTPLMRAPHEIAYPCRSRPTVVPSD